MACGRAEEQKWFNQMQRSKVQPKDSGTNEVIIGPTIAICTMRWDAYTVCTPSKLHVFGYKCWIHVCVHVLGGQIPISMSLMQVSDIHTSRII